MEPRTNSRFENTKKKQPNKADDGDGKEGNMRYNNKSREKSIGKMIEEAKSYAYLIIWPSPLKGNYIQAQGGVEVAHGEGKADYGMGQPVHYVKIGLQQELANRVDSYDTHTPSSELPCDRPELILLNRSVWFRHLQFNEQILDKDKLTALGNDKGNFKEGSSSALYLEYMLLRPYHPKDYYSQEWFAIEGRTAELQTLCKKLNGEKPDERRGKGFDHIDVTLESKNGTTKEKKEVNIYNNETTCIEAFRSYAPNVFEEPTSS